MDSNSTAIISKSKVLNNDFVPLHDNYFASFVQFHFISYSSFTANPVGTGIFEHSRNSPSSRVSPDGASASFICKLA